MQLFVVTVDEWDPFFRVLNGLAAFGMNGLVLSSHNMRSEIMHHRSPEPVPIFGFLSRIAKQGDYPKSFTLATVLEDDKLEEAKEQVRKLATGLKSKALMMAIPLTFCEELPVSEEKKSK